MSVNIVQLLKAIRRNAHVVALSAIAASHANKLTGKLNLGIVTVVFRRNNESHLYVSLKKLKNLKRMYLK